MVFYVLNRFHVSENLALPQYFFLLKSHCKLKKKKKKVKITQEKYPKERQHLSFLKKITKFVYLK